MTRPNLERSVKLGKTQGRVAEAGDHGLGLPRDERGAQAMGAASTGEPGDPATRIAGHGPAPQDGALAGNDRRTAEGDTQSSLRADDRPASPTGESQAGSTASVRRAGIVPMGRSGKASGVVPPATARRRGRTPEVPLAEPAAPDLDTGRAGSDEAGGVPQRARGDDGAGCTDRGGEEASGAPSRPRAAFLVLAGMQFVLIAAITVVVAALPAVQAEFGVGQGELALVMAGYGLAFGGLLLLGGRVADWFGQRRAFVWGVLSFGAASAGAAAAPGFVWLLLARFAQGVGAALAAPAALALVPSVYADPVSRARALVRVRLQWP